MKTIVSFRKLFNPKKKTNIKYSKKSNKFNIAFRKIKSKIHFKFKLKWLFAFLAALLIVFVILFLNSWLLRSYISKNETYPNAIVMGVKVGGLNEGQLNEQLSKIKEDFGSKEIKLVNGETSWTYKPDELGVSFNVEEASNAVWKLNDASLIDKYKMLFGNGSSNIVSQLLFDKDKCVTKLGTLDVVEIKSVDASYFYDGGVRIKPDQSNQKYNSSLTCDNLINKLNAGQFNVDVSFDVLSANITTNDLESKLDYVKNITNSALTLKKDSYQKVINSDELLSMLTVSKNGSETKVDWAGDKVNSVVDDIASHVNTSNKVPSTGTCQRIVGLGGNWLDKDATKNVFNNLSTNSSRNYDLQLGYHDNVVRSITPVSHGNNGTVYLTFDDGMDYADKIMDYAACYGIKITFFEIGSIANSQATALRRAIAEGHSVQSHATIHAVYDYGQRSYDWQYNDIKQSIDTLTAITGVRPTYFRPPGGNKSDNTYKAAADNNIKLILWTVSSRDATAGGISSAQTCSNVLNTVFPGAVVLMHSTHYSTAEAVPCIIEGLAARGYNMNALW